MKNFLLISFLLTSSLIFDRVLAQERTVAGKVTSQADGEALPGVNVVLKGTSVGTVTDIEGNYTINIPDANGILVFSFIGLVSQEVEVASRAVIDLQMAQDVTELSEVLVTAVGIQRKTKALGYSVENIGADQVQQISEPDAVRALQGKVPGVYIAGSNGAPGSATRITIRGNASLLNSNLPLFVVDGIPFDNQEFNIGGRLANGAPYSNRIADLDPNNIESMTVLKGGAAAALYGSRAANGVVVVTTKSGSSRNSKKGLEVILNSSYSFEEIANLPDYQNTYGAGVDFTYGNVNGSWGPRFSERDSIPHWYGFGQNGFQNAFPQFTVFDDDGNPVRAVNIPYVAQPDNVKDFLNRGSLFENSVTISGGNEVANITAVASRLQQEGIIPNSEFNRTNLSIGGNTVLANKLILGGSLSYVKTETKGPPINGNAVGTTSITSRLLWMNRTWPINDFNLLPAVNPVTGGSVFASPTIDNPYWLTDNAVFDSEVNRVVANMSLTYDLLDWITLSYKIGINTYTDRRVQALNSGSVVSPLGFANTDDITNEEIESNFLVTLSRDINEDLDFTAVVGHNINQRTNNRQSVNGTGIVSSGIFDLDNTSAVVPNGGTFQRRRLFGVFADVSLGYKNFLFLNMSGRNDWSSTLPEDNRSFFYPAVSSSFVFTDAFKIQSKILTSGKLRAGWSKVGNDALPYLLSPTFGANPTFGTNSETTSFPFLGIPGASEGDNTTLENNSLGDPNLTPEFTTEIELGFALQLLDSRVGIDFTYYSKKTTDQILQITVPAVSGYDQLTTNIGESSNEGVEIGVNVVPVQLNNGFRWEVYGSFTHNRNMVEDLGPDIRSVRLAGGFSDPTLELIPGQPYGVIFGSVAARDDEGNFLVASNGWNIKDPNFQIIGDPNPDYLLNATNTFSFKGLTLSAVFDFKKGGDIYSRSAERLLFRGTTKDTENRETSIVIPGFLGDGNTGQPIRDAEGNKIPNNIAINANDLWFSNIVTNNGGASGAAEFSVFDGTVLRLREVSLAYDFPKTLLEKTPFGGVRISFTGRNLWYHAPGFPEHTNFDPELGTFGSTNAQGLEFSTLPTTKRYGVNLRVSF
ncbi:SusC/RagA family TonB-linked outer membrane protein [Fulvivirga sp. M361]|uniref:SusC/RagA family TonB-linked outer membrane protein n=1 Tax=Fulvivirga sp. M361 TaxID=2594266 RepID=UPI00117AB253|nr:SusC/RagA family TonB-linked outer membrane protein [Fulvivirga sp. M361]TRX56029.1 SusC/RagA family TonB-linked outer membrane protein [Fulvivirga sp. M361]